MAWARELPDAAPNVIDGPMIRERRVEAAVAVLDVLSAEVAEHNAAEGEPHPVPSDSSGITSTQMSAVFYGSRKQPAVNHPIVRSRQSPGWDS
jgi:hypothetical protein